MVLWGTPLLLFSLLISCGGRSDRELIMELMDDIGKFAEKKDVDNLMKNFSDSYSDFQGRRKRGTQEMLEDYFKLYRGIVIHMLSTRIDFVSGPEASIHTEVALSSGPAKVLRKLVKYSNENYHLTIKLVKKEGTWKIRYAEWKYVSLEELYPESTAILRKIFPDIQ